MQKNESRKDEIKEDKNAKDAHLLASNERYFKLGDARWYSDNFQVPDKKGPVAFFNGIEHKVILDWDFNANEIAEAIDEIYTDFEFFDVKRLSSILAGEKDHERFRALASKYIKEHLLKSLYEVFGKIASDSLKYALSTITKDKETKRVPKRVQLDIDWLANKVERLMREREAPGPGRPDDTGTFDNEEDFLVVLQYGFDNFEGKLIKENVWKKMREHDLFKRKESKVGTLDTWIKEHLRLENWTEAKKKFYKPNKTAKK